MSSVGAKTARCHQHMAQQFHHSSNVRPCRGPRCGSGSSRAFLAVCWAVLASCGLQVLCSKFLVVSKLGMLRKPALITFSTAESCEVFSAASPSNHHLAQRKWTTKISKHPECPLWQSSHESNSQPFRVEKRGLVF